MREDLRGDGCVSIQHHRSYRLRSGMERFFPVNDVAEAQRMKNENPKYLLAGEEMP